MMIPYFSCCPWIFLIWYLALSSTFINCAIFLHPESDAPVFEPVVMMPETFLADFREVAQSPLDTSYPRRIRDLFLRIEGETVPKETALVLLEILQKVARNLASIDMNSRSFDDLILYAFLEKFAHKLVQLHEESLPKPDRLKFGEFRISNTLQSAIFTSSPLHSQNFFDYRNFQLFNRTFKREMMFYNLKTTDKSFLKPDNIFKHKDGNTQFILYENVYGHPDTVIQNIIQKHALKIGQIVNKLKSTGPLYWKLMNQKLIDYLVVLSIGQDTLYPEIPHYYLYTDILQSLRMATLYPRGVDFINDKPFWVSSNDPFTPESVTLNAKPRHKLVPLVDNERSRVFTGQLFEFNLDVWFNYIKSARSSKIFDYPSFQYLTDHLLNVPKFVKLLGNDNQMELIENGPLKSVQIVKELTGIVKLTLNQSNLKDSLISRAVNISVILVRFISRLKADKPEFLSKLYNIIASFINDELSVTESSRLHFALAHICSVNLSNENELSFINLLNLQTSESESESEKDLNTLEAYHWFRAQIGYPCCGEKGKSVADDQFDYGINPTIIIENNSFLKSLLAVDFFKIPCQDLKIEYLPDGQSVKAKFFDLKLEMQQESVINLFANGKKEISCTSSNEIVAKDHLPFLFEFKTNHLDLINFIKDPSSSSSYINFNTLYTEHRLKNILLTNGKNVGVSADLIQTLKPFDDNLEGTHLLAVRKDDIFKVILISSSHAIKVLKDFRMSDSKIVSEFWICDLSGSIIKSNTSYNQDQDNILTILPASRKLIFDALIFNASLPQILADSHLNTIYREDWINKDLGQRARFLLQRMKGKEEILFEKDDQEYKNLLQLSSQVKDSNFSNLTNSDDGDYDYEFDIYYNQEDEANELKSNESDKFNYRKFAGIVCIGVGSCSLILIYFYNKQLKYGSDLESDHEDDYGFDYEDDRESDDKKLQS